MAIWFSSNNIGAFVELPEPLHKWDFNNLHQEWSIKVPVPAGRIRGCVTPLNPSEVSPDRPPKVWGTIELAVEGETVITADRFDDPVSAIAGINEYIINLMAEMLASLANATPDSDK